MTDGIGLSDELLPVIRQACVLEAHALGAKWDEERRFVIVGTTKRLHRTVGTRSDEHLAIVNVGDHYPSGGVDLVLFERLESIGKGQCSDLAIPVELRFFRDLEAYLALKLLKLLLHGVFLSICSWSNVRRFLVLFLSVLRIQKTALFLLYHTYVKNARVFRCAGVV